MTPKFAFASLVIALASVASFQARAWGPEGHKIVCAIAWNELTPNALDRVQTILRIHTEDEFVDLCNWADRVRPSRPETSSWHYVNVPHGATSVDVERDCLGEKSCVVMEIGQNVLALQDSTADDAGKAEALKFLAHLVGDIHQPLHVSFEDDKGGNDIKGTFFKKKTTLHAIWDSGLIQHEGRPWQQIAQDLAESITSEQRAQWTSTHVLDWANESLALALAPSTRYVEHGNTFHLGKAYEERALPVALERLKHAGVRLGATINAALESNLE